MKSHAAPCPSCSARVEFPIGAVVCVCEFCRSVVARTNQRLEDFGKVAELFDSRSPLALGTRGKFQGKRFELIGRVQYKHPAGGVWNEWYVSFPTGKMGWLAEAQGKFQLLLERSLNNDDAIPAYENIGIGNTWRFGKSVGTLSIVEKGTAQAASAEGAIPWAFRPGAELTFADLQGESGACGTLDFSGPSPVLYLGREVTLAELGIAEGELNAKLRGVAAVTVNCPQCAGELRLIAPEETQRVACPSCSSLLDADQGKLQYLKTLRRKKQNVLIPIGASGIIDSVNYTVIGLLGRYVLYEGKKYPWSEYLLYNPSHGFRWLVCSEGHWSFVKPVSLGDADRRGIEATYKGETYRLFQKGTAIVDWVLGEFYWRVEVGERVETKDYVAPPNMLSIEVSEGDTSGEINVSLGTYLPPEEIEATFKVQELARPWSVGPNQPAPSVWPVLRTWMIFLAVLALLDGIFAPGWVTPQLDQWLFFYAVVLVSLVPIGALLYNHSFDRMRWSQSDYSPYAVEEDE